jgi:hypothetical protein
MASLHREISNHLAIEVDQDYRKFRLLKERRGLVAETSELELEDLLSIDVKYNTPL